MVPALHKCEKMCGLVGFVEKVVFPLSNARSSATLLHDVRCKARMDLLFLAHAAPARMHGRWSRVAWTHATWTCSCTAPLCLAGLVVRTAGVLVHDLRKLRVQLVIAKSPAKAPEASSERRADRLSRPSVTGCEANNAPLALVSLEKEGLSFSGVRTSAASTEVPLPMFPC